MNEFASTSLLKNCSAYLIRVSLDSFVEYSIEETVSRRDITFVPSLFIRRKFSVRLEYIKRYKKNEEVKTIVKIKVSKIFVEIDFMFIVKLGFSSIKKNILILAY